MDDQWTALANAIVLQAALDWLGANKFIEKYEDSDSYRVKIRVSMARYIKHESECFFLGERITYFTDLDGRYILKLLKEEAETRKDDPYGFAFVL